MQGEQRRGFDSLGGKILRREEMKTHSSVLAGNPMDGRRSLGATDHAGSQRVGHSTGDMHALVGPDFGLVAAANVTEREASQTPKGFTRGRTWLRPKTARKLGESDQAASTALSMKYTQRDSACHMAQFKIVWKVHIEKSKRKQ